MYSRTELAKKYLSYLLHAHNGKGHGVHSPFVFDFIIHVLNDKKKPPEAKMIEQYRKELLANKNFIEVEDFGAGSALFNRKKRRISSIAGTSLKKPKYAQLLCRIAKYFHCQNILEMGTSLGTTTAYFAICNPDANIVTLEGSNSIAGIAENFFRIKNLKNIRLIRGDFKNTLPEFLNHNPKIDLAFIDGNHKKEPTLRYFNLLLEKNHEHSIFIFDDIHWSAGMEEAWETIHSDSRVTLSIDLFFLGIVFFKKEFMVKQDFTIRF